MANVRDFGAHGDGLVDDSAAIEHALRDGDGVLEFPRGEYRIDRTILIDLAKTGPVAIHGSGGTARLLMQGAGPALYLLGHHQQTADPSSFTPAVWARERMPTLREIEIEGRNPEADGIQIQGLMQATISGVLIRRVRHAVHLTERCRNVVISDCHLYDNSGVGVFFDRVNLHQANIVGSHLSYNRLGGIRIENSEIRNLQITGNDIEYNNANKTTLKPLEHAPTAEIYIDCTAGGTVREGTIASNTIQATASPQGANIRIIGGLSDQSHKVGMLCITGNLIGSQTINIHLTRARGITLSGNYIYSGHQRNLLAEHCRNLVVGANCFGHNPDYNDKELCTGIRLEDCHNATLTGLQIQDAQAGEHTVAGTVPIQRQGLIELIRCRQLTLTGVQVLEGSPYGLYLEDCAETLLTGCSILDTREVTKTKRSLYWTGTGQGNMIGNCRANCGLELPPHVKVVDCLAEVIP